MKKILWVGDSPECPSGFGRVTREISARLDCRLGGPYEVAVLGVNHRGDPGTVPYPVYTAAVGGDPMGVRRLHWTCNKIKLETGALPDLIIIQADGWQIPDYVNTLRVKQPNGEYVLPEHAAIPIVAAVPIDGKNFQGGWLDGVSHTVFWTQFAHEEARLGGYAGTADIIPLGVDLGIFHPVDRRGALDRLKIGILRDSFIVGNVNRNQSRKRWDLTIKFFSEWVKTYKVKDAILFLHAAPTGDTTIDVHQLARYYGVHHLLAFREPPVYDGTFDEVMRDTYNCFDLQVSTTQGEGFGLTTLEGMACGVPQIVPDWSALGDWAKHGAWLVPCKSTIVGYPFVNVIGGEPDERSFVTALNRLYVDKSGRKQNAEAALECSKDPDYRWENIGNRWIETVERVLGTGAVSSLANAGQGEGRSSPERPVLADPCRPDGATGRLTGAVIRRRCDSEQTAGRGSDGCED